MQTIHSVMRNRVSPLALSVPLLACSAIWFAGAGMSYATTTHTNDWSATPMFWMLILLVIPPTCFSLGTALVNTRRQTQLSRFDWCALAAACVPVTIGSVLAVMVATWTSSLSQASQDTANALKTLGALAGLVAFAISGAMVWKIGRSYMTRKQTDPIRSGFRDNS